MGSETVWCSNLEELGRVLEFLSRHENGGFAGPVTDFYIRARLKLNTRSWSATDEVEGFEVRIPRRYLKTESVESVVRQIKGGTP